MCSPCGHTALGLIAIMKQLPADFVQLVESLPIPSPQGLIEALSATSPSVSVRRNPAPKGDGVVAAFPSHTPVAWSRGLGMYLPERPDFTLDPLFHAGAYYVQDASSMAIAHVIAQITRPDLPVAYADACAAPGGKTTAALSVLPEGSLVVANEYVPSRAAILRENLMKWGDERVVVTVGDTANFARLGQVFDIIAADVPCSGEGMMRKDDEAVSQWSTALVEQCARRQWEIVCNLWQALKPGGHLIYSTCTFNTSENEQMVGRIISELGAEPISVEWPAGSGIVVSSHGARFMPHLLSGEGLFISVLRKSDDGSSSDTPLPKLHKAATRTSGPSRQPRPSGDMSRIISTVASWVRPDVMAGMDIIERDATVRLFPKSWSHLLAAIEKSMRVSYAGVDAAEIKGRDIIPSHPLAMWRGTASETFPTIDLPLREALGYLHKDTFDSTYLDGLPKGYVMVTYRHLPLGWIKNIGNRANNLYPKEWRILKPIH